MRHLNAVRTLLMLRNPTGTWLCVRCLKLTAPAWSTKCARRDQPAPAGDRQAVGGGPGRPGGPA